MPPDAMTKLKRRGKGLDEAAGDRRVGVGVVDDVVAAVRAVVGRAPRRFRAALQRRYLAFLCAMGTYEWKWVTRLSAWAQREYHDPGGKFSEFVALKILFVAPSLLHFVLRFRQFFLERYVRLLHANDLLLDGDEDAL